MNQQIPLSREMIAQVRVVNVHAKDIRPYNLKEWMEDPTHLYIGRARIVFIDSQRFPPENSPFHNPFRLVSLANNREKVEAKFRQYMAEHPELITQLGQCIVNGVRQLGCWCAPEMCHGHILMELLKESTLA